MFRNAKQPSFISLYMVTRLILAHLICVVKDPFSKRVGTFSQLHYEEKYLVFSSLDFSFNEVFFTVSLMNFNTSKSKLRIKWWNIIHKTAFDVKLVN